MLNGGEPSDDGRLKIELPFAPVSLQANPSRKNALKNHVVDHVRQSNYLLAGDIRVSVEWTVHEQLRYESCSSADLDNVVKPLLDALCGPQGIMVDDSQVQAIACSWVDSYDKSVQSTMVELSYMADEYQRKKGLFFLEVEPELYLPMHDDVPAEGQLIMLDCFLAMMQSRNKLLAAGADYYTARGVMSVQRLFHRGRLGAFRLKTAEALRRELSAASD